MEAPAASSKAKARRAAIAAADSDTAADAHRMAYSERMKISAAAPAAGSQISTDSQGMLSMDQEPEDEVPEDRRRARRHRAARQADHARVDLLQPPARAVGEP